MDEETPEKLFYSITEVAELFKVNASLIRFWEKEFDFLKPRKTAKGNRTYTKKDLENIKLVYHLVKEKGFTLQGAKEKLKQKPAQEINKNLEAIESLNKLKSFLLELKSQLQFSQKLPFPYIKIPCKYNQILYICPSYKKAKTTWHSMN